MATFANRRSDRTFSAKELSAQDVSDLLWAAMGKNREDGKLTAPSCRNFQEIRLFVFTKSGVSEYFPATHSLREVVEGDYRKVVAAGQDFVNSAPLVLVMIADMNKFGNMNDRSIMMASVDAGIVSENVCVAAAGLGFATVPRATMDADALLKLLSLDEKHIPIMNNPVGYKQE